MGETNADPKDDQRPDVGKYFLVLFASAENGQRLTR